MTASLVTEDDLRKEHALRRSPIPFEEAMADRGLRICLSNLAAARKRRANEPAPQLELTAGGP